MQSNILTTITNASPMLSVGAVSANLMALGADIEILENAGAKLLHFDVMDGCFVPSFTVGPVFISSIQTTMLKDVHLMIDKPENKYHAYVQAGADILTLHAEAGKGIKRVFEEMYSIESINHPGERIIRGIAINPATSVHELDEYIDLVDMVVVMAVDPANIKGYLESTNKKFLQIKEKLKGVNKKILLTIDGGINAANISSISKLGADIIVSGSSVFKDRKIKENFSIMAGSL